MTQVEGFDGPVDGIDSPGLASTLAALARASTQIAALVRTGALLDQREAGGDENVHGEVQIALDVLATERFSAEFAAAGSVAGMACEELGEPEFYGGEASDDRYPRRARPDRRLIERQCRHHDRDDLRDLPGHQ